MMQPCERQFHWLDKISADRSKAVVPVLVLLFIALWYNRWGDLFYILTLCYFVLVFFSPFCIATTSLREERANLSAFLTFVRFVLVWFYRFPLPIGAWKGLRFVIVTLTGLLSFFSSLFKSLLNLIFMFSLWCIENVGSLYANRIFMYFCIKSSIGTQGEVGWL